MACKLDMVSFILRNKEKQLVILLTKYYYFIIQKYRLGYQRVSFVLKHYREIYWIFFEL